MDLLPLSLLNDFLYCPRRAALKIHDGLRSANEHTVRGDLHHEHADLPGFEHRTGWKLLRALPVWSDTLGLNAKADIVETKSTGSRIVEARPVEYKSGRKSRWLNDQVQLCAQALCLEEMLDVKVETGLIFHAKSQQRTLVPFDETLRQETLAAITSLHALSDSGHVPPARLIPQCDGCSLHAVCLPEAASCKTNALFKV